MPPFYLDPSVSAALLPTSVTVEDVEGAIAREDYTVLPDGRTTICTLTLYNGFTVRGEASCVAAENFDVGKGNKFSRQRALDNVWLALGTILADRRYHAGLVSVPRAVN